jgi:hypothetical protein
MMNDRDEEKWRLLEEEVVSTKERVLQMGAIASRLSSRQKEKWVRKASELAAVATELEKVIADQRAKNRAIDNQKPLIT